MTVADMDRSIAFYEISAALTIRMASISLDVS